MNAANWLPTIAASMPNSPKSIWDADWMSRWPGRSLTNSWPMTRSAHSRDELGFSEGARARPVQAALASGASFATGASMPLLVTSVAPQAHMTVAVSVTSLTVLALRGTMAARAGGAAMLPGAVRVTFWGALAMTVTAGVGTLFGTVV